MTEPTTQFSADDIRRLRERRGENQVDFGKHFGVDGSTVSHWETQGLPSQESRRRYIVRELEALAAKTPEPCP